MAQDMDEAEALRAEVAELRAEVDRLRALVNPPTGSGVWPPAAAANACAAGFAGQVYQLDLSHPMKIESWLYSNTGCAAAVPQTLVFSTAGGQ